MTVKEGRLNFGNHNSKTKEKVEGFVYENNKYKVSSYNEATRLEKNEELVLETVPGTTIHDFEKKEDKGFLSFSVEGFPTSTIITAQLEEDAIYRVTVGKDSLGSMKSNVSGKVKFSIDLTTPKHIVIEKA